jgi:hypothetical protein
MRYDQWDYQHITTFNFLPFVLRRMGAAPSLMVGAAFSAWLCALGLLGWMLRQLRKSFHAA